MSQQGNFGWVLALMCQVVSLSETLEKMSRLREESQRSPSPPPAASRRRQAHRKAREKKVTAWEISEGAACAFKIISDFTCKSNLQLKYWECQKCAREKTSFDLHIVTVRLTLIISMMQPPLLHFT